ncbi:conserved unknown protein [Ectocarpus siliculosus]|uniref:Uncharacterized protein n=1 Tax=Ectocarpus siliculosus TaxID=2880 RepID=D8LM85_ECTSI|nr:conserved unknown protein [Ectocarpus siliculosus]|eukprot:CBN79718.1 conserved unknown protein [Ectocarpus siliculosus]
MDGDDEPFWSIQLTGGNADTCRIENETALGYEVGGDIWCAALLLSAWLLENPQLVQGTRVLELGSGLGLCGIVAGYLSKSVTLTDYVDELLVNLEHNVDINHTPRIDAVECRGNGTSLEPPSESQERQQQQQQHQQQKQRGRQRLGRENESLLEVRPLSPSRVRVRKLDWTAYDHDATEAWEEGGEGLRGWWWDDPGRGGDRPGKQEDRGGAEKRATTTTTPSTPQDAGATLRCDVAIGSALVYSPHHACVADVLSRAFAAGGCRAGYILQLSTRPGFDDFLHRLGSCGLRYRLRRMSDILPGDLLEEIHQSASIDIVGGPVTSSRTPLCVDAARDSVGGGEEDCDGGKGVDAGKSPSGSVIAAAAAAAAAGTCTRFDEFVMCEIFRATEEQQRRQNS